MIDKHNKPFELADMDYIYQSPVAIELKELIEELYSSSLSPEYLWAYTRIIEICNLQPGMKVLDGGGADSPIIFYCAKKGIDITTIEQQESLVEHTKEVADRMGWNNITAIKGDMTETGFSDNYFDAVFSVSVLQFLPPEIKIKAIKEFTRILKPEGILGLIFDFGQGTGRKGSYEGEYHDSLHRPLKNVKEIYKYIIQPSELPLYGNQDLTDKITVNKHHIRKALLADFLRGKSLKRRIAFPYLFFKSPYFYYTFYSLFLKK